MKNKQNRQKAQSEQIQRRIAVWAAVVAIAICSLIVVRGILLGNAQKMGNEIAHRYTVEGERSTVAYEALMRVTTQYIDNQLTTSNAPNQWIQAYLETVSNALGENRIDPYAVISGEIVAANPWEGDADFEFAQAEWYQKALEANGEIIYTDGYRDAITGRMVITLAQESAVPGNVVAFDIFPEQLRSELQSNHLPEGSAYFLCDSSGQLLYQETDWQMQREELQEYLNALQLEIQDGNFVRTDAYIHALQHEKWAAYYDIGDNGWISVVVMPYYSLLQGVRTLSWWYFGILLIFFITLIGVSIREKKRNQDYKKTSDTVRVLGNSYYAIYRVDFSNETYDMIKGSEYVRQRLPMQGNYAQLLQIIGEVMTEDAFKEFQASFSIDNIKKLVSQRIRDYGGDFKRLFGTEYRWVNIRLLFDESLHADEAVLCFREVNNEKKLQLKQIQLLQESLKVAKKSEEARNTFFSNMSHDMRTPLNAIIGLSQLMEKHISQPDELRAYLNQMQYSSRQLLELINDILEMSKLENGKMNLENRYFYVKECIQDCSEIFRSQAEQDGKHFISVLDIRTAEVYGDAFRLTQILNNLLSNALKFTTTGDTICIRVKELEHKEYISYQIIVEDTGVGMSEAFLYKIFVPYERETRFGARNISGTGLGMPITKHIISQMNGEIAVESKLGEGTTFTVTLPFKKVDSSEEENKQAEAVSLQEELQAEDFLKGKRILLAEDNAINMEISFELLTMYGAEVVKAWNGREAVEQFACAEDGSFDAILMDMHMPEMDGCEASRKIRSMEREDAKTIPILAVTANAFAEDLAATAAAGMNAHIAKPIDFPLLCKTLKRIIEHIEKTTDV